MSSQPFTLLVVEMIDLSGETNGFHGFKRIEGRVFPPVGTVVNVGAGSAILHVASIGWSLDVDQVTVMLVPEKKLNAQSVRRDLERHGWQVNDRK